MYNFQPSRHHQVQFMEADILNLIYFLIKIYPLNLCSVKCKTKANFDFFIFSKNLKLFLLYQNTPNTNGEIVVFDKDLDLQIKIQNFNVLIY